MAQMEDVEDVFVDYDIEEDFELDDEDLDEFNEFENCEVEVPDDISVDDLDDIDSEVLPNIPVLTFCSEENIDVVVVSNVSPERKEPPRTPLICPSCHKSYTKKYFFDKHLLSCGKFINIFPKR